MQHLKIKNNMKKNETRGVNSWLDFSSYVTKYRYNSYWHQFDEIFSSGATSVLEIGVGNNVLLPFLESKGVSTTTLDLESSLAPKVIGSVTSLPFADNAFDVVVCCQVLEHLPFDQFDHCLKEIRRVTNNKFVLSLPDKTLGLSVLLRVPNFLFWEFQIFSPWAVRAPIRSVKEHYWEIGRRGYPPRKIIKHLNDIGFSVERHYRVPEYPYHHFFISTC